MTFKIGTDLLKYIPILAAIYAFYEYYADRGLDGIRADLEALTIDGVKAKLGTIIIGAAAFIIGDLIATQLVSNKYLKVVVRAIAYYIGAKQLASALRQGAGVSSGGRARITRNMSSSQIGAIRGGAY